MLKNKSPRAQEAAPESHSPRRNSSSSLTTDIPASPPLTPKGALKDSVSSLKNLFRTSSTALKGKLSGGSKTPSLESSPRDMRVEETVEAKKKDKEPELSSASSEEFSEDDEDFTIPPEALDSNASVPSLAEILPIQMPAALPGRSFSSNLRSPRIIDETHKLVLSTFLLQINSSFLKINGPSFFASHDTPLHALADHPWHTPETLAAYAQAQESLELERLKTRYIIQFTDLFDKYISKPYADLDAHTDEEYQALYNYFLETIKLLSNPMGFMNVESFSDDLLQSELSQIAPEYIDTLKTRELKIRAELLVARLRFQNINAKSPLAKPLFELLQQLKTLNIEEPYSMAVDGIVNTLVAFRMCKNHYKTISVSGPDDYISLEQLFETRLHLPPKDNKLITQNFIKKLYQALALKYPDIYGIYSEKEEPAMIFLASFSPLTEEIRNKLINFIAIHEKIPYTNELKANLNNFLVANRLAETLNPLFIRAIQGAEQGLSL